MSKDPQVYLIHILESVKAIEKYMHGRTLKEFMADQYFQDAVVRRLEIIGEAVAQMPKEFKETHPSVQWHKITATRNKLIHEYFGLEYSLTWEVMTKDLPELKLQIADIVDKEFPNWKKELF